MGFEIISLFEGWFLMTVILPFFFPHLLLRVFKGLRKPWHWHPHFLRFYYCIYVQFATVKFASKVMVPGPGLENFMEALFALGIFLISPSKKSWPPNSKTSLLYYRVGGWFWVLPFFFPPLSPRIFALTTPLGILPISPAGKVCAVSVRKTVKLSTMGHFLANTIQSLLAHSHTQCSWPRSSEFDMATSKGLNSEPGKSDLEKAHDTKQCYGIQFKLFTYSYAC